MAARKKRVIPTMGKKRTKQEIKDRKEKLVDAISVFFG